MGHISRISCSLRPEVQNFFFAVRLLIFFNVGTDAKVVVLFCMIAASGGRHVWMQKYCFINLPLDAKITNNDYVNIL